MEQNPFIEWLDLVNAASEQVKQTVARHNLPNPYTELQALLARQKSALENLIAGEEIGCELSSLMPERQTCFALPHLQNLAYAANCAKADRQDENGPIFTSINGDLHKLKGGLVAVINNAYWVIEEHIKQKIAEKIASSPQGDRPLTP